MENAGLCQLKRYAIFRKIPFSHRFLSMKIRTFVTSFLLCCATAVQADLFTLVPFQEYADARQKVFNFFDSLHNYSAYLVADDGQFLGKISRSRYGFDSLSNEWSSYGNSYNRLSIFNSSGTYGSSYSDLSPFCQSALRPPTIRYKQGGVEYVVAYLTRNPHFFGAYAVANVDPSCLCDWISAMERCK